MSRRRRHPGLAPLFLWLTLLTALFPLQAAAREVVVGVFDNPPIVLRDPAGQFTGLAVDALRSVAEQEGWQLRFVYAPWKTLLGDLKAGRIDLLVGIAFTPERSAEFDFTKQTLVNNWGVVIRGKAARVTSLPDLAGQRVALMSRSIHSGAFRELMQKFDIAFTPVEEPTYEDVLTAVGAGEADAGVVNRTMSILKAPDYEVLATGIVLNPVEVRYAAPKGRNADVLAAIDAALAAQKQDPASDYHLALERWLNRATAARLPEWVSIGVGIAAALLLLLLANNYVIRRRVARRTAELSETETRFRQLAENIRDVFWIGTPTWDAVLYVSPAYESIWGRSAKSLYAEPLSWLEAVHPADREAVMAAIRGKLDNDFADVMLPDYRIVDGAGQTRWIQARAYPIRDDQGRVIRVAGLAEDITQRKASEDTIRFMAFHDPLTRLHNRHAFEAELKQAMESEETQRHALMYVDLDQFKVINDTCGHTAGDQMLQGLTAQLREAVDDDAVLARLGGDEFGILLKNCDLQRAQRAAREVLDTISAFRFVWDNRTFSVGASIGLVIMEDGKRPLAALLSAADIACYAAKESGRNRIHVYREDDKILQQREGEMHWVARLKDAVEQDGFVLHAQPIAPLQGSAGTVVHREFLMRLQGADGELILPGQFLPAAERFDLMPALDRWVVRQVCSLLGAQRDKPQGIAFVNLSGQVLNDDDFASFVLSQLQNHQVPRRSICFEITETAAIANLAKATALIAQLREQGVLFALDDFGTGMSSFGYLRTLPVDFLKIDGFFIKGLLDDHMNPAIVEAITRVGHKAGLTVIAEWVEDGNSLQRLRDMGIDYAQGYAIGHPVPLADPGAAQAPQDMTGAG